MWVERMVFMKKTREIINEERRFLRLCSQAYKEKIQKKRDMTLNDFNRFHCVLKTLRMCNYSMYFCIKLFPELLRQAADEEEWKRKNMDILFPGEDNIYAYADQYQKWLCEFWEQMPLESQRKKYKDLFGVEQ